MKRFIVHAIEIKEWCKSPKYTHMYVFQGNRMGKIQSPLKLSFYWIKVFSNQKKFEYTFLSGKVNSFFGVAEAMMPLVYAPMYTTVYTATLKTFPGAFFLLGGGLTIPAVLIFL